MKYKGEIFGINDSYNEDDDGTCRNIFEVYIEAKDRKTLEKLKNNTRVKIEIIED